MLISGSGDVYIRSDRKTVALGRSLAALILCGHADEMSESRQTHVTLHDIDPQALEQLVQYAYTAEIVVGEGNVQVKT